MASNPTIDRVSLDLLAQASRESNEGHVTPPRAAVEHVRMRSSVACVRCRRSKVKCLNQGPGTPCRTCSNAGRECTYPEPLSDRLNRSGGNDLGLETPRAYKSRAKRSNGLPLSSNRALVDALDPTILTQAVWSALLDIWERHYSTDLSFIHPPTFQDLLRQVKPVTPMLDFSSPRLLKSHSAPSASPEFLLAFLALTSRFLPELVLHHSKSPGHPLVAAEYYAAAARNTINLASEHSETIDLEHLQAFLMLAVYEWSHCNGVAARVYLAQAVEQLFLFGLVEPDDPNYLKTSISKPIISLITVAPTFESDIVNREIKRRIFWSCYLVERLISSGAYRPLRFKINEIKVPLPIPQHAFLFSRDLQTKLVVDSFDALKFLVHAGSGTNDVANNQSPDDIVESSQNEGVLSYYLQAAEIYNAIVTWALSGGRLSEEYPPWNENSTFMSLWKAISTFVDRLPRDMSLTPLNLAAHHSTKSLSPFTLLHVLMLLSQIILHREWLPFIPFKHNSPKGPADTDLSLQDSPSLWPESFWDKSASDLFRSVNSLLELLVISIEWKALPETPLVTFASYMVTLLAVYNIHFPWMDANQLLSTNNLSLSGQVVSLSLVPPLETDTAKKAAEILFELKTKLKIADVLFSIVQKTHLHYLRVKKLLRKHSRCDSYAAIETGRTKSLLTTLSEMQANEYKSLEPQFGPLPEESEDVEMQDVTGNSNSNSSQLDDLAKDANDNDNNDNNNNAHSSSSSAAAAAAAIREGLAWSAVSAAQQAAAVNGSNNTPALDSATIHPHPDINPYPAAAQTPRQAQAHNSSQGRSDGHNQNHNQGQNQSQGQEPLAKFMEHVLATATTTTTTTTAATMIASPSAVSLGWDAEQAEAWLMTLELKFGAQDLAVFTEGLGPRHLASIGGWVSQVWNGKIAP